MSEITIDDKNLVIGRYMDLAGTDEFIRQNYKFHLDWNTLMLVVEKIERDAWVYIEGEKCSIYSAPDLFVKVKRKSKIEATHDAVYQCIQRYNQKQKEQQP